MIRKNITLDDKTSEYLDWLHKITELNRSLLIRKGIKLLRAHIIKELNTIVRED